MHLINPESIGSSQPESRANRFTHPAPWQNRTMIEAGSLDAWWAGLTADQRRRAAEIAARPAPRGMAVDDLAASMIVAGLPTSRMVWTGQPEHLVEMLDDVADFVRLVAGR